MGFWDSIVAIAGVVAAPFTGGASLWLTAAAVVAPKVVNSVMDFVMKPFMNALGVPDMSAAGEAERQQGALIQRQGSVVNVPVVYGYRKVGDIITFAETGSSDNKYLWVAHVYSEGEIAGLAKLFCDDNELPANVITRLNAGQIVDVDSGKYNGRMRLQFFKGIYYTDPDNAANPVRTSCFFNTDSVKPPSWTSDMVYNGLAVLFARYEWKKVTTQEEADAQPYSASIPSMTAEIYGKKLSAIPDTAPSAEYDADTARYQVITTSAGQTIGYTNPAEVLLDYLRNPRYGKGLKNSDIDWESWNIAAEKCSTEVTYASGIRGPILSCNFILDTSQTLFSNTKNLLSNFRGYMPYVQGRYRLKIEDAGDPTDILSGTADIVATFDRDNIVGDIVYTGIERTSKYNQVVVTWVDPDNKWSNQEVVFPETESERQYFIDQDGGRENKGTFTASAITNVIMAKDLARIIFYKSRLQDSISLTVSAQGIELEPGDNIHINGNIINMTGTYPYRVISVQLNNDMSVTLGCVFNPDVIYPYTRWNEPDRVLPVYVPRGAERYYPAITASEKNGLLPPYPGKFLASNISPKLTDVITISEINFVSLGTTTVGSSDNIYADIKFNQPNTSLYGGTTFYWKQDVASATTWAEFESLKAPGANQEITVRIGPVVLGKTYKINTRVMYQSGQVSTQMGTSTFTVGTATVIPVAPPGTPTDPSTPPVNFATDFMASVSAVTVLEGGLPLTSRQVKFTLVQDMTAGISSYLNAVEVFWKPSVNTKWSYYRLPVTTTQGSPIDVILDCGPRVYPLVPGSSAPEAIDDFDFIFRWAYSDGAVSNYQYRAMSCSVEYNGGYDFNPLLDGAVTVKESSTNYVPIVVSSTSDITDTRNIGIVVKGIKNEAGPAIRIIVEPPVATDIPNWQGTRVYRHRAGVAGVGDYYDATVSYDSGTNQYSALVGSITLTDNWEYVVVPLVKYGNTTVEANQGQYMSGKLISSSSDQIASFRVDDPETLSVALAKRGSAVAIPPNHDTKLAVASAATVLTSSHPSSPRKLSFSLQQDMAAGSNGHITGVAIYYKQQDATYWKKSILGLLAYSEGSPIAFDSTQTTPAMDLGYPSYPTFPGREQIYDFRFRFVYDDGLESTFTAHFSGKIEDEGTSATPDYAITLSAVGTQLIQATTSLVTESQAPAGAVMDIRDILSSTSMPPLQMYVYTLNGVRSVKFYFGEPIASIKSSLAGFRILRRPVVAGTNPNFATNDANFPYRDGDDALVNGVYYNTVNAVDTVFDYHTEYEWAVIPVVWYQGIKVEANKCIYWRGRVTDLASENTRLKYTSNFWGTVTPQVVNTPGIRNKLYTRFPDTDPVVKMQSITRTNAATTNLGYHTITYQVPASFVSATIYRRCVFDYNNVQQGSVRGKYYDAGNFAGAGRWEKITVSNSSNPLTTLTDGTKTQTVNLRPAIYDEFNNKMNPTLPKWVGANNVDTQTLYVGYTNTPPGDSGSTYATTQLVKSQYMTTQLFIVINYTKSGVNTLSTQGLRVDLYDYRYINGVLTYDAPGVIEQDCVSIATADMEAAMDKSALNLSVYATAGNPTPTVHSSWTTMYRKMSEGRTSPVANNKIQRPGQSVKTVTYSPPSTTPPVL